MSKLNTLLADPLFVASAPGVALQSKPLGFIDIGARRGVHPSIEPLAGATAALLFEPDREEFDRLQSNLASDNPWKICQIEPLALAGQKGNTLLQLFSNPNNNSLRLANLAFIDRYNIPGFDSKGRVTLPADSLDGILFKQDRAGEDYWGEFLKLDTQGTELEILQGAKRTLSERTAAIIVEVEFCYLYEGQKLFSELEIFLRESGFSFYGFEKISKRSRKRQPQLNKYKEVWQERAIHADAVFFKDPLPGSYQKISLSERGNYVLFTCALLLGYYDFALELALATWAVGEEAKRIEKLVRQCAARPPEESYSDALALADRVSEHPELANIEVGHFVDRRRQYCDCDDVSFS